VNSETIGLIGLIGLMGLVTVNTASAGVVGGLNTVNENRSYYYDDVAPTINITSPLDGSTQTSSDIPLTTSTNDTSALTCDYSVTNSAGAPIISLTPYDCIDTTVSILSNGNYILFVNATDGKYVTRANSSFTLLESNPGGGGGKDSTIISSTSLAILDFSITALSISVIAPPSSGIVKELLIKNIGSGDVSDAELELSSSLEKYLKVRFCDINKKNCKDTVNLEAGESGFLIFEGFFPANFIATDGILKVKNSDQIFELKISLDRLPLYQIIDPSVEFVSDLTGTSKNVSLIIVFTSFLAIIGTGLSVFT